jgi:hypothetical protein
MIDIVIATEMAESPPTDGVITPGVSLGTPPTQKAAAANIGRPTKHTNPITGGKIFIEPPCVSMRTDADADHLPPKVPFGALRAVYFPATARAIVL